MNAYLASRQTPAIDSGIHLAQLLKRAELDYQAVDTLAPVDPPLDERVTRQVEIETKYEAISSASSRKLRNSDTWSTSSSPRMPTTPRSMAFPASSRKN